MLINILVLFVLVELLSMKSIWIWKIAFFWQILFFVIFDEPDIVYYFQFFIEAGGLFALNLFLKNVIDPQLILILLEHIFSVDILFLYKVIIFPLPELLISQILLYLLHFKAFDPL